VDLVDLLGPLAQPQLKASLARKETEVQLDLQDSLDRRGWEAIMVQLELLVPQGPRDPRVLEDLWDPQDLLEQEVQVEIQVPLDQVDRGVRMDRRE